MASFGFFSPTIVPILLHFYQLQSWLLAPALTPNSLVDPSHALALLVSAHIP